MFCFQLFKCKTKYCYNEPKTYLKNALCAKNLWSKSIFQFVSHIEQQKYSEANMCFQVHGFKVDGRGPLQVTREVTWGGS